MIEARWCDMVSHVPHGVLQPSIIRVVINDLIHCDSVARLVLILSIGKLEYLFDPFATEWCVSFVCGNWWSHVLENHCIVS